MTSASNHGARLRSVATLVPALFLAGLALGCSDDSSSPAGSSSGGTAGSAGSGTGGSGGVGGSGAAAGSGGAGGSGGMAGAGGSAGVGNDYPAGPYGNDIGDTLPNLAWEGYVNDTADGLSTTKPRTSYSMDDLRRSGRAYAFVHVSEFF